MNGCSSNEMLSRLLEDQLDNDAHASIVEHVEICVDCQERLKALTTEAAHGIEWGTIVNRDTDPWLAKAIAGSSGRGLRGLFASDSRGGSHADAGTSIFQSHLPRVDGYELVSELGHGGMGVVYKAHQYRLNRIVALKMIRAGVLAESEDLARFRIEAEAVAELRHPNIIEIYDIGEAETLPFVALELLEGGSLDDFLAGNPQPGPASASMVATLARAINAAHRAGIIHRDLKPSNVLFTAGGTPKITDFGLAKRLDDSGYTRSGQVLGSPSYIPPEQAGGRSKRVGPAADVYALGAILYEMLTGRPPFKGTTPVETVMQVLNDEPVPPCRLQSQVPRDLETICLKCLAKDPAKRYSSAQALADDLQRYLDDEPIQARPTPLWERGVKWAKRRPTSSSVLTIGFVLLSIMTWALVRDRGKLKELRDTAAGTLAYARDHMADDRRTGEVEVQLNRLVAMLSGEPRLTELSQAAAHLLKQAQSKKRAKDRYRQFVWQHDDALFQDTQLTGLDPIENLQVIRQTARAALELLAADGCRDDTWKLAPWTSWLTETELNEVKLGCYEILLVLAEAVAQPLPGEATFDQAGTAIRILDRANELHRPTQAYHLRLAQCLEARGDKAGTERELLAAEAIKPDGAFDHFLSGRERFKRGLHTQARAHFARALEAQPNHFWAQCLLAICDLNKKPPNPEEAKAFLTACLQSHPDLPWLYLLRGFASGQLGSACTNPAESTMFFDAAEADYQQAINRDADGRFQYALLTNRGLVRFHSRRWDDAIADLNKAIVVNPRQYSAYVTLAQIFRKQNQLDRAITQLDRAIALEPPSLALLYRTRGAWNLERRDPGAALVDLDQAIRHGSPGSRELASDYAKRAHILLDGKQTQAALEACDRALAINPGDRDAHQSRVRALLELKRYRDVIDSCDVYLRDGARSAELFEVRGHARAKCNDFAGAIDDYTLAISIQPNSSGLRGRRGWSYLVKGAAELALRDFEEAIRLDTSNGDAYSGRGSAAAILGHYQNAAADAEESLRHGEPEARMLYNAARILAQAATAAAKDTSPPARANPALARRYQDLAIKLLGQAIDRTHVQERTSFWNDVIRADQALTPLHRTVEYQRWSAEFAVKAR